MKIVVSGPAAAFSAGTRKKVTDAGRLRRLDGLPFSKDRCAKYLDRSLREIGLTGGVIRLAVEDGGKRLRVVTEYRAARRLQPAELDALVSETVGQWTDGIGEGEFLHRETLGMDVDFSPSLEGKVRAEQVDDGKRAKKPRVDELMKALHERNPRLAARLLAGGAEVNGKNGEGDTPLHVACHRGYFDLARRLLGRGADARAANKSGDTPLARLAMAEPPRARAGLSVPLARELLEKGADVDARNRQGQTPLMWAVNRANLPLVRFLIGAGADVNARDRQKYNESTVLMYASRVDVAKLLLRHGADPAARNAAGEDARECALLNDHVRGYRRLADLIGSYLRRKRG